MKPLRKRARSSERDRQRRGAAGRGKRAVENCFRRLYSVKALCAIPLISKQAKTSVDITFSELRRHGLDDQMVRELRSDHAG